MALCHCGRPTGHTGRHVGTSPKAHAGPRSNAGSERRAVVRRLVETELKACHATIVLLKGEINARRDALTEVELRLSALKAMLDVYQDLALPAPAAQPVVRPPAAPVRAIGTPVGTPPPAAPVESTPPPASQFRVTPAGATCDDDDRDGLTPIVENFTHVQRWAQGHGMECASWDDLPAINRRRARMEAPPFRQPA